MKRLHPLASIDRRALLKTALAGSTIATFPGLAHAQGELIPLADFHKTANLSQLRLSPDRKSVLAVRPRNGRANLAVFDIAAKKWTTITNFSDGDVVAPSWVSDKRVLFGVLDRLKGSGDQFNTGLMAIDKDANDFVELSERSFISTDPRKLPSSTFYYAKGVGSGPDEVLVSVWSTGGKRVLNNSNIHRLDTRTGRSVLLTAGGPGKVFDWIFDDKGIPRLALVSEDDGIFKTFYRASESVPWEVIFQHRFSDANAITPLALGQGGKIYVLARTDSDFEGVHVFDAAARKLDPEPLARLKGYDLTREPVPGMPPAPGEPLVLDEERALIGIRYHAEKLGTFWLDDERRRLQESLEATFPGKLVSFQGNPKKKGEPLLLTVRSDIEPEQYLLYYPERRQLENFGSSRPWLSPARLSPMQNYSYQARDGLTIPATLTVPRGRDPKGLPLIVLHYGGPWVRPIRWGFDPNVQFLASRGYAVMMPAPRGSTGFGWSHFRKGWKQWGLAMQDDVTDGVRELIGRGVADPKRICLMGASYGGYLTMMGLAKEPDLFRCGVNWIGVTDPELMYIEWTDFAAGNSREVSLPTMLGHPKTDAEQFARTSPLRRASEIKQPVLMAYGGSDRRVPIVNGEKMRDALAPHNKNVEWIVYGDEGHGWLREDHTLDFWSRVEGFLAKHMS